MSLNLLVPPASELAINKANNDGTGLANPATWRANLDVPSNAGARRMGPSARGGIAFDGSTSTTAAFVSRIAGQAIGTGDFSVWIRCSIPSSNPSSSQNLFSLVVDGNNRFYVDLNSSGQLRLYRSVSGTTSSSTISSVVATYGGKVVDIVVTRSGASSGSADLKLYIDETLVLDSPGAAQGGVNLTDPTTFNVGNYSSGYTGWLGSIFRAVLFNRCLSAADVSYLCQYGVNPADEWGSCSPIISPSVLNGGFETAGAGGADTLGTWSESISGTATITQQAGGYSGSYCARLYRTSSGDTCVLQQSFTPVLGKRYRVGCVAKTTGTGTMRISHSGLVDSLTQVLTGTWTAYTFETIANGGTANLQIFLSAGTTGELLVDDVTLTRIGAIIDLDLAIGVGGHLPDRSSNRFSADASATTGFDHLVPVRSGCMTVVRDLAHSDISSSAATTKLLDLPPNCAITGIEFDRTSAFDASTTVSIGVSGTAAKFVNAQSVSATGIVRVASSDLASQSNSASTPIYIQKNQATTGGAAKFRLTIEIRG